MEIEGYLLIGENTKTETYKEYHRTYFSDIPVSFIHSFSSITLKPNEEVTCQYSSKTLIIPITGGIEIDSQNVLIPGEYWLINEPIKDIKNASPDTESTILVLELNLAQELISSVLQIEVNNLGTPKEPCFGLFKYRDEQDLRFKDSSDCFIYIVSGNFEIEERFVKQGDALILENTPKLAFECLSEQGLFLFIKD